jgi:hypothetical protein
LAEPEVDAELFGVDVRTVSEHLRNVYATDELHQKATIRQFRIVQTKGAREVDFYNLDAIIAVGYRVNSYRDRLLRETKGQDPDPARSEFRP